VLARAESHSLRRPQTASVMKNKPLIYAIGFIAVLFSAALTLGAANLGPGTSSPLRRTLSLDGTWQIAEGKMDAIPSDFARTAPVPGLVDQAKPAFAEPGPTVADRGAIRQKDSRRDAFWYRKTFKLDATVPPVATLKVGKAMYGTRVYLNGRLLGDHLPCFTPGYFDARAALKTGDNELLIRLGADRDAVGQGIPSGFDFEKERYLPGIFDSVELILSGTPAIKNVQVAPDITNQLAHVRIWLSDTTDGSVAVEIHEAKSGKLVGQGVARPTLPNDQVLDLTVPVAGCHLWSPESPFLYQLSVRTSGDEFATRFGMRDFRFEPATGRAMLNGRPYFMRGSNITLYRFFEDHERGSLPWDETWVRNLHRKAKDMHWNCFRYCIGFPPEFWYRIADEEGFLIDDEFPIWFGDAHPPKFPEELKTDELAKEYAEWMQERWNHPCVVIWDANNETVSDQTTAAIRRARGLDLSRRPWNNSYTPPDQLGDMIESHPYHFWDPNFKLASLATPNPILQGNAGFKNDGSHAAVINEYGWLWLNRDGSPTTLTEKLYQHVLGTNSTTEQRRHLYALYTAAETEYWRAHRQAAAVMQFTMLGYSRADGQTSDNWLPGGVARLQWEPEFYQYVRDAFAPVGLMIGFWDERAQSGAQTQIPVTLINDRPTSWSGPVTLCVKYGDRLLIKQKQKASVTALGTTNVIFNITWPEQTGLCALEAELKGADHQPVHSVREVTVK